MTQPTDYEQYMLEMINRARSKPTGEAEQFDIGLNQGLSSGTISGTSKPPLAFNTDLIDAAREHSRWMLNTNTFSHKGAGGSNAGDRMEAAGYEFNGSSRWGENIAWRGTTGTPQQEAYVTRLHESLFESSGHRKNILQEDFREIGVGLSTGKFKEYNAVMATQNYAKSGSSTFLTGVVYDDAIVDDDFYTVGEGINDVRITAKRQSDGQQFSTTTYDSGGYQMQLEAGDYIVSFLGSGFNESFSVNIDSQNVKLDLATDDLSNSQALLQAQAPQSLQTAETTIGEAGRVENFNHNKQVIRLDHEYENPVVFAQPLSGNGGEPAIVRITDIKSDRFSAYLQEPQDKDGRHANESFSYLVLEAGNWELDDGTKLEVGTVNTNANVSDGWQTIAFDHNFSQTPVVLSQVQTANDPDWMRTRLNNVDADDFAVALEQGEALKDADYQSETVGWLAMESGVGNWNGLNYQAGTTPDAVTHQKYTLNFNADFSDEPQLFASIGSYDGDNPSGLRYVDLSTNSAGIRVEEDTTLDRETWHTTESVNFLAIEDGTLTGTAI
ncbi:MAG: CAP domain-containing protein [Cyanophyceae cyanobacterium]